ncbi:MAG: MATE family efflux transporter [Acidobacteriota bacterium]
MSSPESTRLDISYRRILRLTWPVLVSQLSFTAMGIIDTVMVGRLGVTALAAVGLGHFLSWWILSFFWGLLAGVNTLVAQAVGARRHEDAAVAFWQGVYLSLLAAGFVMAMVPAVPWLVGLTGASPEVRELTSAYMSVRLLGGASFVIYLVGDNFYRGLGETRVPMWCGVAQALVNCGLNYLLIFGKLGFPALGVVGAGWGTAIAQLLVGLGLHATILARRQTFADYGLLRNWRFEPKVFLRLTTLSLPIAVQVFMEMGGITVFTAIVARIGDAEMAATNAVIQAWSVAFMAGFALSVGATTLVGQSIGAGVPEEGRRAVRRILHIGLGLSAVLGLIYGLFPEALMALFVEADQVDRLRPFARPLFMVVVASLFFDLLFNVLSGALRGAGDTKYPMVVNIGSAWLLFVPAAIVGSLFWGLEGAWWALFLHVVAMAVVLEWRFRGDGWIRPPVAGADGVGASQEEGAATATSPGIA